MQQFINLETVEAVARGLKELRDQVVFVGGAVLGLYVDEPAADTVRMTKDIDLTIELINLGYWAVLQERLAKLGFFPNPMEQVICRYQYQGIQVDIMPASDSPFGPSNEWYLPGIQHVVSYPLKDSLSIRLLPLPYFVATKFTAYHSRGNDPRSSHDFEDIIYLVDNCKNIVSEIEDTDKTLKNFLIKEFRHIWSNPYRDEVIACHLQPWNVDARMTVVLEKIAAIAGWEIFPDEGPDQFQKSR